MSITDDLAAATLLHYGLFLFSLPKPHNGLYWLRLYRLADERHIAFVTEVPGNPNPMSGAAFIRRLMAREFAIEQATVDMVVIWPNRQLRDGRIVDATWSWLASASIFNLQEIDSATIRAVLALIPPLPAQAQLFAEALERGGVSRDVNGDTWKLLDVRCLPPPHLPFKCRHYERFQKIVGSERTIEAHLLAGERFLETLTDADRRQCPYHQADWAAVSDASSQIIASAANGDQADFIARAKRSDLPVQDRHCLVDLFDEPIILRDGGTKYVNGQHRGCALRFSGAGRVALVIEGPVSDEVRADWTYIGGG